MPTMRQRKLLFATLLTLIVLVTAYAVYENHDWPVPEAAKQMKNPLQPGPDAAAAARAVYLDKCANCHGDSGKGDGPDAATHYPTPTNFTDVSHMNAVTDGEVFYRITNGRKPMPAFKKRLTDEQRWQLVLFIRSLAPPNSPHR